MFNKNTTVKAEDNIFTVINSELERLHKLVNDSICSSSQNTNIFWGKIEELQNLLKTMAEKGVNNDIKKEIKDLQNTVGDILLTESSTK